MEEQGHCEHLWELSDENGFCFIVEYLNVNVIRNFRDADTSYLYGLYHIHSQLHSSLYTQRCIHKVQKVMFTISLLLHSCQKYISLSPLTYRIWIVSFIILDLFSSSPSLRVVLSSSTCSHRARKCSTHTIPTSRSNRYLRRSRKIAMIISWGDFT